MTAEVNTTISAIGVLVKDELDRPNLFVYHNRHAVNRLEPDWLRSSSVRHFKLPAGASSSLEGWEDI
jgi:hypothetical protein